MKALEMLNLTTEDISLTTEHYEYHAKPSGLVARIVEGKVVAIDPNGRHASMDDILRYNDVVVSPIAYSHLKAHPKVFGLDGNGGILEKTPTLRNA